MTPDGQMGALRVVDLQVKGRFHPGETITISAALAEVTGNPFMGFPKLTVLVSPALATPLKPHASTHIAGCAVMTHSWTIQVPKTAALGTEYRIEAVAASSVQCSDPKTCDADRRIVIAQVSAPR